jgi:putative ABC transport system permease protein
MRDWSREVLGRLASLNLPPAREAEIVEEVAQHLEDRYQELVAGGATEDEARGVALEELSDENLLAGGLRRVEQEAPQEPLVMGGGSKGHILADLGQDVRYGLRTLAKNPSFAAVAVITLALGIGANTAIFSVVDAVLVRPLPFKNPAQLVWLRETEAAPGTYPLTGPDYLDWQAQSQTLKETSLCDYGESFNASGAGEPERAYVVRTQANFFSLFGVEPLVGRTFLKGEDQQGRNNVAVLSYGFWQRHFGAAKDAVGRDVELNGQKFSVVGVAPVWFRSVLRQADIWLPMDMSPKSLGPRGSHQYYAVGRLRPGVSVAGARVEIQTIAQRLEKQYPDSNHKVGGTLFPLRDQLVGDSQTQLLILVGAVGLVLLIACANVANLLLVRATGRHQEMAVRNALGAGRGRIIRQLLTESLLLSSLGTAAGLLFGWGCLRLLTTVKTMPIPQPNPITLNGPVLAFTLGIGFLVGILVGLAPALQVSHLQTNEELKATAQTVLVSYGRRRLLRDALVVGEIAISLAMLIGAGLLLRSFAKLREVQLGIHAEGVLTAQVVLPPKSYATNDQTQAFFDQLVEGLRSAHGVEAAAVGVRLPLRGGTNRYITIEGKESSAFEKILVEDNGVTADYFRAFGIPFLKGRNFTQQDLEDANEVQEITSSGEVRVLKQRRLTAIINQRMARQFWPDQDPLGQVFKINGTVPVTVIGVVGDVKEWGIRQPVIPQAYYPLTWWLHPPVPSMCVVVRGTVGTGELLATVRQQVRALDKSLALFNVRTMPEIISETMSDTSFQSLLLSSFAFLALLLTSVGIYGVMAYAVTQRTHEFGIRMALGAHPREILSLVMRRGAQIIFAGVTVGIAGALALTRFLASLLFGIQPRDPFTFAVVAALLAVVALLASYIPARRATKVDPMVALRYE